MRSIQQKKVVCLFSIFILTAMLFVLGGSAVLAQPTVPGATEWYLAEGSTAVSTEGNFETWICLSNSGTNDATAQLTYMTDEGDVIGPVVIVESGAAVSVDVSLTVPNTWSVSTEVNSTEPVVVERQMFWNTGVAVTGQPYHQCAHSSIGVNTPADTWFLAEGSTGSNQYGNFETWVLLQNPGEDVATVDINYQTPEGEKPGPRDVELLPNSRQTFSVEDVVPDNWSVSTSVTSDKPIIAERSMYWNSPHMKRQSAHDSIGVTAPSDTWYLAEGSTGQTPGTRLDAGNFETWILVQNPGDNQAEIDIFYQTPGGAIDGPQDVVLDPHSRQTFDVSATVPVEWSVSTLVLSTEAVIAERSMYWNIPYAIYADGTIMYAPRWCAHDSIGVTYPYFNWEIANCRTDTAFDSWILVQNPWNDATAYVSIDYTTPDGLVEGPQMEEIPPGTRKSFRVSDTVQGIQNVGATVRSEGMRITVVVEHSTYWGPAQGEDPQSYRVSGSDTICFPWDNPID